MHLLPAVDILGGKAVRLAKGDYNAVTVYNDDPVAQAQIFEEQGADWLHVVDLDGARSGNPDNIAAHLAPLLVDSPERSAMLDGYKTVRQRLGSNDSAETAARQLIADLK